MPFSVGLSVRTEADLIMSTPPELPADTTFELSIMIGSGEDADVRFKSKLDLCDAEYLDVTGLGAAAICVAPIEDTDDILRSSFCGILTDSPIGEPSDSPTVDS